MDDALRAELERRVAADQAIRRDLAARRGTLDEADLTRWRLVDEDNTAWLRQVVAGHGWPGETLVGARGAQHAWLLAQHADHDPDFQARCLDLLGTAVAAGEASAADLAYLTDRVRRARDEPQLYGTQFWYGPDGAGPTQPQPILDPEHLDERRAAAGLGPFSEYEALMRADDMPPAGDAER